MHSLAVHTGETEKEMIAIVEERYDSTLEDRRAFDKRTMTNRAQYAGKHQRVWSTVTDRLELRFEAGGTPDNRTFNLQLPMIQRMSQRLGSRAPSFTVVPATHETEDVNAAGAADALIKHFVLRLGLIGKKKEDILLLALIDSLAFMKYFWNSAKGTLIDGEQGRRHAGSVDCAVKSSLMVALDPLATEVSNAKWLLEFPVRNVKDVFDRYGVEVKGDRLDELGTYQLQSRAYYDDNYPIHLPDRAGDHVMVKEYWEAPNSDFNRGRIITTAGGKLLSVREENPYYDDENEHNGIPYVDWRAFSMPDRLQGISPIQQGQPAQEGLNAAFGQIESYHKRTKTLIVGPPGSLYDGETYDDEPFEFFEYNHHGEFPRPVQPPPMAAEAYRFVQSYHDFYRDTTMTNEAIEGNQLPNVRSADHWLAIQEQGNQNVGPILRNMEDSHQSGARWIIRICRKFMMVPEIVQIAGSYSGHKARAFTRANLNGNYDVWVLPDSLLPFSPAARFSMTTNMYDRGWFGQPGSRMATLKAMQHVGVGSAYLPPFEDDDANMQRAIRENSEMNESITPKGPAEWHDHDVDIYVHKMEMNQPDFLDREQAVITIYQEHLFLHEYMKLQTAMNLQSVGLATQPPALPPATQQQGPPQPQGPPPPTGPPGP